LTVTRFAALETAPAAACGARNSPDVASATDAKDHRARSIGAA
jgi:hypothetical protein